VAAQWACLAEKTECYVIHSKESSIPGGLCPI
jgi:hypothetical protein